MIRWISLVILCAWGFGLQAQVAKTAQALQEQRFAALVARDTAQLNRLLSDDLVYIHSNAAVENKTSFVQNVGSGKWQYKKAQVSELQVRHYGNTRILTGRVDLEVASGPLPLRFTEVQRKGKKGWQTCSWHSTKIN